MFVSAIEEAVKFTNGIRTIERVFLKDYARPGAATMFFVNDEGYAITCKHVAEMLPASQDILKRYSEFKVKRALLTAGGNYSKKVRALADQYSFNDQTVCELLIQFSGLQGFSGIDIHFHPTYDLAILKFKDPILTNKSYAKFLKDGSSLKQGMTLCRLGFPFPEFTNFEYTRETDSIGWTTSGVINTPCFPIDGMITRHIADQNGIWGIEMSTPGLGGQSGGPLFNSQGVVCGMQSSTRHLHLGFDKKNEEMISNGEKIKVTNQALLHVGQCIHVDIIKEFLAQKGVNFHLSD